MQSWADWLDHRFNHRLVTNYLRNRLLPNGPSWLYTSASCLLWLLLIQCFTGLLLMASYCPSMTSAWASVNFIDQSTSGRFLRGIHHYASHAMIVLFGVHLIRVIAMRAYGAPREFVWITGLLLFPLIIVWTVTGNPLAASQKGIAQIQVEGNILGSTPLVGPLLQRVLFGGDEVGTLTLTRLYFLHVGLLPLLVGVLVAVHLYQVLRHSPYRVPSTEDATRDSTLLTYWPYQSVRNMTVLAAVVAILALLASLYGAPLSAPADSDLAYSPRPEWYFRWLFELRRYFTGDTEFVATMVIPAVFLFGLMSAPFFDRLGSGRLASLCRFLVVSVCCLGWAGLTFLSYRQDWNDSHYIVEQEEFELLSARAIQLARTESISEKGANQLLRNDPQTQGPRRFARHCASCHSCKNSDGQGVIAAEPSAPNLYGVGRADWIMGFLDPDRISSDEYFGRTKFREGDMAQHIQSLFSSNGGDDDESNPEELKLVAKALAAEAGFEKPDSAEAVKGRAILKSNSAGCIDCHRFHEEGALGTAVDLTGYASTEWLTGIIAKPTTENYYADRNDRMPEFAADPKHPELNLLSPRELDLLVRWLRSEPTN